MRFIKDTKPNPDSQNTDSRKLKAQYPQHTTASNFQSKILSASKQIKTQKPPLLSTYEASSPLYISSSELKLREIHKIPWFVGARTNIPTPVCLTPSFIPHFSLKSGAWGIQIFPGQMRTGAFTGNLNPGCMGATVERKNPPGSPSERWELTGAEVRRRFEEVQQDIATSSRSRALSSL